MCLKSMRCLSKEREIKFGRSKKVTTSTLVNARVSGASNGHNAKVGAQKFTKVAQKLGPGLAFCPTVEKTIYLPEGFKIKGRYLMLDVYSRKIVAYETHDRVRRARRTTY